MSSFIQDIHTNEHSKQTSHNLAKVLKNLRGHLTCISLSISLTNILYNNNYYYYYITLLIGIRLHPELSFPLFLVLRYLKFQGLRSQFWYYILVGRWWYVYIQNWHLWERSSILFVLGCFPLLKQYSLACPP